MEELNSGLPKTNPSSVREEDLNLGPPDYESSALPLGHAHLPKFYEMLSTWESLVLDVVDQHAPLKSVRVKSMKKPMWLSDQILTAIQERDRLKKELEKGRILKASFNAARNKVV